MAGIEEGLRTANQGGGGAGHNATITSNSGNINLCFNFWAQFLVFGTSKPVEVGALTHPFSESEVTPIQAYRV